MSYLNSEREDYEYIGVKAWQVGQAPHPNKISSISDLREEVNFMLTEAKKVAIKGKHQIIVTVEVFGKDE